jgi:hypothetical protein
MGKKSGPGINNPDLISESLETIFWVKIPKFTDVDPGTWMGKIRIRDRYGIRDGKNSDPGIGTGSGMEKIRIRYPG